MKYKKVMSMLSICQKAGRLLSGEFVCEKSLQEGNSFLIILADDASNNTKKKFSNKAFFYNVPIVNFSNKEELSSAIGKVNRSVISIIDEGFANKIQMDINEILL